MCQEAQPSGEGGGRLRTGEPEFAAMQRADTTTSSRALTEQSTPAVFDR